jgi:hypothetical protein
MRKAIPMKLLVSYKISLNIFWIIVRNYRNELVFKNRYNVNLLIKQFSLINRTMWKWGKNTTPSGDGVLKYDAEERLAE